MHRSPPSDEKIFADALALPARDRPHFLATACAGDNALRQEIESLLDASAAADGFLETPPLGVPPGAEQNFSESSTVPEITDQQIGRYKLLKKIGEGGCGGVYLAEQQEPVRRQVALKVIKLGMDTAAVIARFEAERQALALMDHPHIARVLDAGSTETGRPYFVMELVHGIKITDYCDQHRDSIPHRLKLFNLVCLAVQHAHEKGVIHRDLKPSNILVNRADGPGELGHPKIIDFGIAKATQGRLTDRTLVTVIEQFIGTPGYMSPEQAEMSGREIDPRTDIYSLGVLLYELLTGKQPFDPQTLRDAGLDEIRRMIREVDPPKPSARFATLALTERTALARLRGTEPAKLSDALRGDLDWIVMKALDKNRTQRYETASALAADIRRHLHHEPVIARPRSTAYRLQKLIRRNRPAFVTATFTALLIGGLGLAMWSFTQEKAARAQAEGARLKEAQQRALAEASEEKAKAAALKSEQAFKFIAGMLKGVEPSMGAGLDTALLRKIMDKTVGRLDTALRNQPEAESNLRFILSTIYLDLGEYTKAEFLARAALADAEKLFGPQHENVAGTLVLLGQIQQLQGHGTESEPLIREALAIARKIPGAQKENLTSALIALSNSLLGQGRLPEAETYCREALSLVTQNPDIEFIPVDLVQMTLAAILQKQGRLTEAAPIFDEALAAQLNRNRLGQDHPMVIFARLGLSQLLMMQSKLPEAEAQFRESLATLRKSRRHEYPAVVMVLFNLAYIAHQSGQLPEAEIQYREVLTLQQKVFGPEHPATQQTVALLAQVIAQKGRAP